MSEIPDLIKGRWPDRYPQAHIYFPDFVTSCSHANITTLSKLKQISNCSCLKIAPPQITQNQIIWSNDKNVWSLTECVLFRIPWKGKLLASQTHALLGCCCTVCVWTAAQGKKSWACESRHAGMCHAHTHIYGHTCGSIHWLGHRVYAPFPGHKTLLSHRHSSFGFHSAIWCLAKDSFVTDCVLNRLHDWNFCRV